MLLGVDISRLVGPRTGVGRYLEFLLEEWSAGPMPFDRVRLFSPEQVSGLPDDERFQLVESLGGRRGIAWQATKLRRATRGLDVLFAPYVLPPGYRGRAVVATLGILEGAYAHASLRSRSRGLHAALSARRADVVLVHSANTREDVIRHYRVPPERIELIHLGVTKRFRPGTDADRIAAAAFVEHLTGSPLPYLLFVGKLSRRRNVPLLLEALARLDPSAYQLLLVGPNTGTPSLSAVVSRLRLEGRVHHVPHLDQGALAILYRGARAFVLLTEHEGFSATILEALASGCPVLTFKHEALHEADVGRAVLTVARLDPAAVTDAVLELERDDDLRMRLRREGLRVAASLTFRETARRTMEVLARVAERSKPEPVGAERDEVAAAAAPHRDPLRPTVPVEPR
jgi:glycosyltransferase involved in cell wall biosynthesis